VFWVFEQRLSDCLFFIFHSFVFIIQNYSRIATKYGYQALMEVNISLTTLFL
jgi:uncharacterized membrane protein